MPTALDVIRRSMRLIGVLAEGEVPTAEQAADGLTALQGMLGEWETRGVYLGALVDTSLGLAQDIPVPPTHVNALAFNLAVSIAPEYGRTEALQGVLPQAERQFSALAAQYHRVPIVAIDPALTSQTGMLRYAEGDLGGVGGALYGDSGAIFP